MSTPSSCRPAGDELLLPVRMLNEFTYCPRLAYLEWVQGEFADSADTVEGRWQHRRVDEPGTAHSSADETGEEKTELIHTRSVDLAAPGEGLVAKMDLLAMENGTITPVDYKKGKRPHVAQGAWEPERVQLCAQGLILRENGYRCTEGVLYFVKSRERVRVPFDDELIRRTRELVAQMRTVMDAAGVPEPLEDSPKCPMCSLAGICLPDEVNFLHDGGGKAVRPLAPPRDDTLPLYVQKPGARLKKAGDTIEVYCDEERIAVARWLETSQIVLFGPVQASTQIVQEACRRSIPVLYLSTGGWFYGMVESMPHKNVVLRQQQYAWAADPRRCLKLARRFVQGKILNCRTMLRRNLAEAAPEILGDLKTYAGQARRAPGLPELLGIEGNAAHRYFGSFGGMLKNGDALPFDFNGRNRRPPRDPVNALLSFAYSMLVREWTVALLGTGFDPFMGFYHQPRYGRPALALDLMEEFRPLIADSTVLTVINNGEVRRSDFIQRMGSVALTPEGRARFLAAFERRMNQEITHPVFGYSISYRRILAVQARLLARHLCGEIPEYPLFVTR